MRPVRRGCSPRNTDFENYEEAKPDLVARLGSYCSYCERRIPTLLEVEHIQPKGLPQYRHLEGRWENFLLACRNCNATKGDKDVELTGILLPDRDNTLSAFIYSEDGTVSPPPYLLEPQRRRCLATLSLTGLDKAIVETLDENGKLVALDRVSQRMEVWGVAEVAKEDILNAPGNLPLRRLAVQTALGYGFFSIWFTVFLEDLDMRNRLIDAFAGTRESGCFEVETTAPLSPAPNPDGLPHGGKT